MEAHEGAAPKFYMRVVKYYKSALSRQIGEAVRIRRRGGAGNILNSKAEFDRCKIPRLIVEEQDLDKIREEEEQEIARNSEALEEQELAWGSQKLREREQVDRESRKDVPKITGVTRNTKREHYEDREQGTKRSKKAKYMREPENWGEQQNMVIENHLPAPNWEPPPKEQVLRKRKLVQSSIKELLLKQVEAPLREPPEPAGYVTSENIDPIPGNKFNTLEEQSNTPKKMITPYLNTPCDNDDELDEQKTLDHHPRDDFKEQIDLNATPPVPAIMKQLNRKATRPLVSEDGLGNTENNYQSEDLPDDLPEVCDDENASCRMMNQEKNDELCDDEMMKCTFTRKGICNQHGIQGKKFTVSSQKWTKLRGGTFGYRTSRVTRYRCNARISDQKVPDDLRKVLTRNSQRFSDSYNYSGHAKGDTVEGLPENLCE